MNPILPRFTQPLIEHDPLEAHIASMRANEAKARAAVAKGHTPDADPADLRGIPCIARGTSGTSPGTNPTDCIWRIDRRTGLVLA